MFTHFCLVNSKTVLFTDSVCALSFSTTAVPTLETHAQSMRIYITCSRHRSSVSSLSLWSPRLQCILCTWIILTSVSQMHWHHAHDHQQTSPPPHSYHASWHYQFFFIHQPMHKWVVLKTTLKFTLKQLRHVLVQSHHHQGAQYSCLLKLQSIKIHRCLVNTVVMWLHILGPYWCMYVALFGCRLTHCLTQSTAEQCNIHTPLRT